MPTRLQLAEEVRGNLESTGVDYFSNEEINDALQDGYNTFAATTGCIEKTTSYPNFGNPYWNLGAQISDFRYVVGIYNHATNRWLEGKRRRFFSSIRWDWELWEGQPQYFTPIDFRRICVVPHLNSSSGVVTLIYKATPPIMTDTTVPVMPNQIKWCLANYATADLLETAREFSRAKVYWTKWIQQLTQGKTLIQNLAQSDKMHVLDPYNPLPRFGPGGALEQMFIDNEIPTGVINGSNAVFYLSSVPNPMSSLCFYKNGQMLFKDIAYTVTGNRIDYQSDYIPAPGDYHRAWYRTA